VATYIAKRPSGIFGLFCSLHTQLKLTQTQHSSSLHLIFDKACCLFHGGVLRYREQPQMGCNYALGLTVLMNLTTIHLPTHFLTCVGFLANMFFIVPLFLLAKVKNHLMSLLPLVLIIN
jgi:hypothetical protein